MNAPFTYCTSTRTVLLVLFVCFLCMVQTCFSSVCYTSRRVFTVLFSSVIKKCDSSFILDEGTRLFNQMLLIIHLTIFSLGSVNPRLET